MKSALYFGQVRHRRFEPVPHAFSYDLFMVYLDLAEVDEVFEGRWLWSTRRAAIARWRREDFLGHASKPLDAAVRDAVEASGRARPSGAVRMLTHLRYFGYIQNPVTFYYCFSPDGQEVEALVAEITNTPWGERHAYVVGPEAFGEALAERPRVAQQADAARFPKAFHVSPFMDMEQEYQWVLTRPGQDLAIHMENLRAGRVLFDATLRLRRREITGRSLAGALVRYPWMTARVLAGIYFQAVRLWLKKVPFIHHPEHIDS
ncbi:MAG: DUF1365 domain-containing protein [Gemmatimonadota bacterium]